MALRSKTTTNIAVAGSTIAHGLSATPDEIGIVSTTAAGAGQQYRYQASDATNVYLAAGTSASSADVTCSVWHTLVK